MNIEEITKIYDFTGKTVVITGGTGILGGEMACALVGCGANVVVLDRNPEIPEMYRQPMDSGPGKYLVIYADVLDRPVLENAQQEIGKHFKTVDMLINAVGGNHPEATTNSEMSFFDLPPEAVQWVFNLNFLGTFLPSQVFGKTMIEQGEGVILNISSMSAYQPLTRVAAYSAAKAAISNFTQWLAVYMSK